MKQILLLLFFVSLWHASFALNCYICSIGENDLDQSCVDDPTLVPNPTKNCNKRYCTIVRQEYLDPKGKVASITRGCEDKMQYMNTVIEDASSRMYFTACQTDLCNGGSGKGALDGSTTGNLGDKSLIYSKGIGRNKNSASSILVYAILIPTLAFITQLL